MKKKKKENNNKTTCIKVNVEEELRAVFACFTLSVQD